MTCLPEFHLIEAPTNLGLSRHPDGRERGTWRLPKALRDAGLWRILNPVAVTTLPRPTYPPGRSVLHQTLNLREVAAHGLAVKAAVLDALVAGRFPLVVGGDCSVLIGCAAALAERGRHGLLFLDAHLDYGHPGNVDVGAAAGMDLAIVTGRAPPGLRELSGPYPYIDPAHVSALGWRDPTEQARVDEIRSDTPIRLVDLDAARASGIGGVVADEMQRISGGTQGVWIHLDADVLDSAIMPAVDCPEVNGLSEAELTGALRAAVATGQVVGMNVGILDPELDPDGRCVALLSRILLEALAFRAYPRERTAI